MSINWKKSAELNGMPENELKEYFEKYPNSHKHVIAICESNRNCSEREVRFYAYTDLCNSCAKKKRYEDPEEREKTGLATKKRYEDPEEREKTGLATKKRYEDPEECEKASVAQKKSYRDDPTRAKRQGKSQKEHYGEMDDPGLEICKHHVAYDFNNPDALIIRVTRRFHGQIHSPKGQRAHERGYSLID